jgi:FkbM family methyltransferase
VLFTLGRARTWPVTPDWRVRCHPRTFAAFRAQTENPDCRDELAGFVAVCHPGMVLLDVGSHYGVFTLAALRFGGESARVLAVDPSPTCRRLLRANVRLAGGEARVTVAAAAVGAAAGELPMLSTGPGGEDFLVASEEPRPDVTRVPMVTIPALAAGLPAPVTHLKIDIEGFEDRALAGAWDYLRAARPVLVLELHGDILRGRGADPLALLTALAGCGYRRVEHRRGPISADAAAGLPLARLICFPDGWAPPGPGAPGVRE